MISGHWLGSPGAGGHRGDPGNITVPRTTDLWASAAQSPGREGVSQQGRMAGAQHARCSSPRHPRMSERVRRRGWSRCSGKLNTSGMSVPAALCGAAENVVCEPRKVKQLVLCMLCLTVLTSDCKSTHPLWWKARDVRIMVARRLVANSCHSSDGGPGAQLMMSHCSSDPFTIAYRCDAEHTPLSSPHTARGQ